MPTVFWDIKVSAKKAFDLAGGKTGHIKTLSWDTNNVPGITYIVQISESSGSSQTWTTVAVGLTEKSFDIIVDKYKRLSSVYYRIGATNGGDIIYTDDQRRALARRGSRE